MTRTTLIFGSNGGVSVSNVSGEDMCFKREHGVHALHSWMLEGADSNTNGVCSLCLAWDVARGVTSVSPIIDFEIVLGARKEFKADEEQTSGEEDDDKTSEEARKVQKHVIAIDFQHNLNGWNMLEHIFFTHVVSSVRCRARTRFSSPATSP